MALCGLEGRCQHFWGSFCVLFKGKCAVPITRQTISQNLFSVFLNFSCF